MASVVSLFAGCGGLDLGFQQSDHAFELVYSVDNDPAAVAVYRENVDPRAFVRDVTSPDFHRDVKELGRADVVLGGFPCQGFSKAGPKSARDSRNALYQEMRDTVRALQPTVFVAENVDGVIQNFGGTYFAKIINDFESVGYRVENRVLDAAAYGIPQHRRRVFFVGIRNDIEVSFRWPAPSHSASARNGERDLATEQRELWEGAQPTALRRPKTVRDAIGDLLDLSVDVPDHAVTNSWPDKYSLVFDAIGPGQKLCNVRNAPTSIKTWEIPEVYGEVREEQVSILDTIARHRRHKRYGNVPNGNPLPLDEIERLTGIESCEDAIDDLLEKGYLKKKGAGVDLKGAMFCSGLFKRPTWDEPAPTVLTNFANPRYFLHPSENRPFSLREVARLQSFPDDFLFSAVASVSLADGYRLVGNAVPPKLATTIAQAVGQLLEEVGLMSSSPMRASSAAG